VSEFDGSSFRNVFRDASIDASAIARLDDAAADGKLSPIGE